MQQRNRLLADDVRDAARFEAFERIMAETGVAIAAARAVAVAELAAAIGARRDAGVGAVFPWAELALVGTLEVGARRRAPPSRSRTTTSRVLRRERERDRAAGRTLDGPHRSDLIGRARPQGDARQGVLDGRAEGAADRPRARALPTRQTAPRRRRADPAARRDHAPISTPCGGPRCSTRSSRWAARRGCRAPIRRPSRRSEIGRNFSASRRAASRRSADACRRRRSAL